MCYLFPMLLLCMPIKVRHNCARKQNKFPLIQALGQCFDSSNMGIVSHGFLFWDAAKKVMGLMIFLKSHLVTDFLRIQHVFMMKVVNIKMCAIFEPQ